MLPPTYVPGFHDEEAVKKMKYNPLGDSGLLVSHLSFGGGGFNKTLYGTFDEKEGIAAVHEALKKGVNYIDTAPFYGNRFSEEFLGKALKGIPRQAYYIATKVCRYETPDVTKEFDFSAESVRNSLETSMKLLGVSYVDVLVVHDVEFAPSVDQVVNEALPTVEALKKEGKVKAIAISAYPVSAMKNVIEHSKVKINAILAYCRDTLIDDTLKEYLPYFQSKGIGVIEASSPSLGLLTNKGPWIWHPASPELKKLCADMAKYCKERDVELGRLAVNYSFNQKGPSTHLIGMQTRALINTNLDLLYNGINAKEQQVLKEISEKFLPKVPEKHWEGKEVQAYRAKLEAAQGKK